MTRDTYEFSSRTAKLETYEWDDLWWEHTERRDVPRVVYVGDSISRGMRKLLNELAEKRICFDSFATSKALDNPCFVRSLALFAEQQCRCDAVLFNNGLHGWHLDDAAYEALYGAMLDSLKEIYGETPIVVVLTTCLASSEQNERVLARNAIARRAAEQYGLPILDLYTVSLENAHLLTADGVHFEKEGYRALATTALAFVSPIVGM